MSIFEDGPERRPTKVVPKRRSPKVHGWMTTAFGTRLDCKLYHMETNIDVFWSPRWERPKRDDGLFNGAGGANSYVLAALSSSLSPGRLVFWLGEPGDEQVDAVPVSLLSVNGGGEVRWPVDASSYAYRCMVAAGRSKTAPYPFTSTDEELKADEDATLALPAWDRGDIGEHILAVRHFGLVVR